MQAWHVLVLIAFAIVLMAGTLLAGILHAKNGAGVESEIEKKEETNVDVSDR